MSILEHDGLTVQLDLALSDVRLLLQSEDTRSIGAEKQGGRVLWVHQSRAKISEAVRCRDRLGGEHEGWQQG